MSTSPTTVRLSLRGVVFAIVFIILLGAIGGIIGTQLTGQPLAPLTSEREQLMTTVQQVTISPSKQAADIVQRNERAVMLIATSEGNQIQPIGTALVLTNDGLVVSTVDTSSSTLTAFDTAGQRLAISRIGEDPAFGLTYYQIPNSVTPPFEIGNEDAAIGSQLLALSASAHSNSPQAVAVELYRYILPPPPAPFGWQRAGQLAGQVPSEVAGSALLTDDGKLAGILLPGDSNTLLLVSHLRESLERMTTNRREFNPFEEWGFTVSYEFQVIEDSGQRVFAIVVNSVSAQKPASIAGLRGGDVIQFINDKELTWATPVIDAIDTGGSLNLQIQRAGQTRQLTLNSST